MNRGQSQTCLGEAKGEKTTLEKKNLSKKKMNTNRNINISAQLHGHRSFDYRSYTSQFSHAYHRALMGLFRSHEHSFSNG